MLMPNSISLVRATVTTHRSNSTASFFDRPQDATPQDCREISGKLICQAQAILGGINLNTDQDMTRLQLETIKNLLVQAYYANNMINIAQAVLMAQREEV